MKKTLSILAAAVLVLALATSTVFAATVTVTEGAKVGDTVEVTVKLSEKAESINFAVNYDSSVLKFKEVATDGKGLTTSNDVDSQVRFGYVGDEEYCTFVTVKFEAIAEGDPKISVSNYKSSTDKTLDNATVETTIAAAEKAEDPAEEKETTPSAQPTANTQKDTNKSSNPKTGDNVALYAAVAVVAIVAVAVVAKKFTK